MPGDAQEGVAAAVGASITIPFIFLPKTLSGHRYVDGGIVSNFPAWVFDEERKTAPPLTPTLGFRLIERNRQTSGTGPDTPAFSLLAHVADVFETAVFGDNTLEKREVATLHEVPLRVKIGPLDLNIDDQTKDDIYRDGKNDARDYFQRAGHIWRHSDERMRKVLQLVDHVMRDVLPHNGHLRINIMLPISNDMLQIVYTFNMDGEEDCDDRLQFRRGTGACGMCWERLNYVICDLEDAAETYKDIWKMDKRQQRLVRNSLHSLLCVPLFDQRRLRVEADGQSALQKAFLGVLNIDSDDDLVEKLTSLVSTDENRARDCAAMIADVLTRAN